MTEQFKLQVSKIKISDLMPHEGTLEWHHKEIRDWIQKDGFQERPIVVSSLEAYGPKWNKKFLIHDGHHRTRALGSLGCSFVMCTIFDFNDPRIKVFDYDTASIAISKDAVIQRAISGVEPTPRFDKHFIDSNNDGKLVPFHNNPQFEPQLFVKLSELS